MATKAGSEIQMSVSEYLGADHDRLDALFSGACADLETGYTDEGAAKFAQFRAGLERHIHMEEEVLFPEFERLSGMAGQAGPTRVMRMEHHEIRQLLATFADMLSEGRNPLRVARDLRQVLGDHNRKEEAVLYPMTDNLAGPQGRNELTRRMDSLGSED